MVAWIPHKVLLLDETAMVLEARVCTTCRRKSPFSDDFGARRRSFSSVLSHAKSLKRSRC